MSLTIGSSSGLYDLLNSINRVQADRAVTMARLATGQRITRGADDPAGLIALSNLNAEFAAVNAAIDNNSRSESMLNVVDSTLVEVGGLVSDIQGLVVAAQGSTTTTEEKAAYQAQIDSTIDAIDRIINGAEFNGQKLFNGEHRVVTTTDDSTAVKDIKVYSRDPNVTGSQSLTVKVNASADYAYSASATGYDLTSDLSEEAVIQVTGRLGTATITLASGSNSAEIRSAINAQRDVTGVSAIAGATDNLTFMSTETGSEAFVTVSGLSGQQEMLDGTGITKTSGTDADVTVNGASAQASGKQVFYNGNGLSLAFTLDDDTVDTHTITVSGGGATFQLGTQSSSRASIGIAYMNTHELGGADIGYLNSLRSGGANSLTASGTNALSIANRASRQVASAAGRVGSFNRHQVGSMKNSLNAALEGLSSSISTIGDADYAREIANLDRQNIILRAGYAMLGIMNAQREAVLSLL